MIKYLGSKRKLIPHILETVHTQSGGSVHSVLDLFAGTTRVSYSLKQQGMYVHANDLATYSYQFAKAYIEADKSKIDLGHLQQKINHLNGLSGIDGFITEHYSREARFFQSENASKIDAIRPAIDEIADNDIEHAILLTSLLLAADKVDSTVANQMSYLKSWAKRSYNPLMLEIPRLLRGNGAASNEEAVDFVTNNDTSQFDLVYLDPPYKTVSYFRTYHLWETITRGDQPELTGVPNRRADEKENHTGFNSKKTVVQTFDDLLRNINSKYLLLSYSDEGDVPIDVLVGLLGNTGRACTAIPIKHDRYIGKSLGRNDKTGKTTGKIGGRLGPAKKDTLTEYLLWAEK